MTRTSKAIEYYILLKWGTLKGWKLNDASLPILQKYADLGMELGAMQQQDTPEQKQILCDLVRQHEGSIQNVGKNQWRI